MAHLSLDLGQGISSYIAKKQTLSRDIYHNNPPGERNSIRGSSIFLTFEKRKGAIPNETPYIFILECLLYREQLLLFIPPQRPKILEKKRPAIPWLNLNSSFCQLRYFRFLLRRYVRTCVGVETSCVSVRPGLKQELDQVKPCDKRYVCLFDCRSVCLFPCLYICLRCPTEIADSAAFWLK